MQAAAWPAGPLDVRAELYRRLAGRGVVGTAADQAVASTLDRLRRRVGRRCAQLPGATLLADFDLVPVERRVQSWLLERVPLVRTIVWEELVVVGARLAAEITPALVNLTPHPVLIRIDSAVTVRIPPSGRVVRCHTEPDHLLGTIQVEGHPVPLVINNVTPAVPGLPEPEEGVLFVVSRLVALAIPHRRDMVFPHDPVRDHTGRTSGCRSLAQVPPPS